MGMCPVSRDSVAPDGEPPLGNSMATKRPDQDSLRIPLSEREIFTLTQSWKAISKNMIRIGMDMFLQ